MNHSPIDHVWFTVEESQQRTGVSQSELYEALRSGELVGYQRTKNARWRVHIDDLDRWMRGERTPNLRSA